jgi:tetratricopeptide (TPR) repeat protein
MSRYFRHSADNIASLVQRCFFEADQSRLDLALQRLLELKDQFPDDAKILYAEGVIRRDYLGQGLLGRDLFECAYENALRSRLAGDYCWSAASNAAGLARTEQEYRKWAALTTTAPPQGVGKRPTFQRTLARLDEGLPYLQILRDSATVGEDAGHSGSSAAHMQVALALGGLDRFEEMDMRRYRAQRLRSLDARAEETRTAICEWYPAEERVVLHEALEELVKALGLNPYDPELWNLNAAWQNLLGRSTEALRAADKAAELRNPYPKAHINAALALYRLRRYEDARMRIHTALQQSRTLQDPSDTQQAERLARSYSQPPLQPTPADMIPDLETVLRAARRCSDTEMDLMHGDVRILDIISRVIDHSRVWGPTPMGYIPMIAEVLSDFTPETVCNVMINGKQRRPDLMEAWLLATLYLAANDKGVGRRDACRLALLLMFIPLEAHRIYGNYRDLVLAPSDVRNGPLASLASTMQDELSRLSPNLPPVLADQPPISAAERTRAQREILDKLAGGVPPPNPNRGF